jgi:hypothetical protein
MQFEEIPFAGNMAVPEDICEEKFFETFPDVFNHNEVAIKVWRMAWSKSRIYTLEQVQELLHKGKI